MKTPYFFVVTALLFVGCNEGNEAIDTTTTKELESVNKIDSVEESTPDNPAESKKLNLASMTFEDYAALDTKEKIKSTFDKENCKEGTSYYEEGTISYKHTVVTNPATTHEVKYVWDENGTLAFVEANYKKYDEDYNEVGIQMLKSECGVHLGMKLKELEKWNGKPISFSGFGWDYGGTIMKGTDSKLANCPINMTLSIDYSQNTSNKIMGDTILSSTDKTVQQTPVYVSSFIKTLE